MKFLSAFAVSFMSFVFLTITPVNQAQAFDQQMVLKEFQAFAQQNDAVLTFESAEKTNASDLVIRNLDFYDDKTKLRRKIERLVFINLQQSAGGSISYDAIELEDLVISGKVEGNNASFKIAKALMDGLKFSESSSNESNPWPNEISSTELRTITMNSSANGIRSEITFPSGKALNLTRTGIRNFTAELTELAAGTGKGTNRRGEDIAINTGAVKLENTEFFGSSGLEIGNFVLDGSLIETTNQEGKPVEIRFEGMNFQNLYLPDITVEDRPFINDKDIMAEIKPLEITVGEETFLRWERGFGKTRLDKSTNTVFSEGGFEQIMLNLSVVPRTARNAQTFEALKALNLEKPILNILGKGSWARDEGIININNYRIEVENGGAFSISARMSGYSEEVAKNFSKIMAKVNAETDPQKKNALSLQALAGLAGLTVERLEISLQDNSLLDRVVNLQAARMNREPDQIRGIVGPMVNIALISFDVPEFSAQASQALGSFMQGNKKLKVVAEPENGLVVTEILALSSAARAGQIKPAELIKRLNITVKAE